MFDFPTLFSVTLFVSAVAGLLLVFSWLQNRRVVALALWGVGFLLSAGAMALVAARGWIPDVWTVVVANSLWILRTG